jgi:cytochrome c oxidase assembly factor CtaG
LPSAAEVATWWTADPVVIGGLLVSGGLYARGLVRLWGHAGVGHGVQPWQAAAYACGLAVIALALLSPLDGASDVLFSAHMAQHELLMLIAAPLVVLGRPMIAMLWALPRRGRLRVIEGAHLRPIAGTWAVLTNPFVAVALHALARWVWHVPALFDAALADERVHLVQHASFLATAALFWWTLIAGRYRAAGYGVGVAFVFFTAIHSGLLAAMLSLSDHPWYAHSIRTAAWGIDAIDDQRRAGLLMWVPAGVLMMGTGLALLAAWLGEAERRVRRGAFPSLIGRKDNV